MEIIINLLQLILIWVGSALITFIVLGVATMPWLMFFEFKKEPYKMFGDYVGMSFCISLIGLEIIGVLILILKLIGKG